MTDAEYEYLFRDADPRWKAYYRTRLEEYRKEHPRTNFEKWKESWTPESAGEAMSEDYPYWCGSCPCKKRCKELDDGYDGCIRTLTEWMKEEADEEWWRPAKAEAEEEQA